MNKKLTPPEYLYEPIDFSLKSKTVKPEIEYSPIQFKNRNIWLASVEKPKKYRDTDNFAAFSVLVSIFALIILLTYLFL